MLHKLSWQHEFNCNEGDVVVFNKEGWEYRGHKGDRFIVKKICLISDKSPEGYVIIDQIGYRNSPFNPGVDTRELSDRIVLTYKDAIRFLEKIS